MQEQNETVIFNCKTIESNAIEYEIWKKIVSNNAKLANFFEITVKSAAIRQKPIPATILICPDEKIRNRFLSELARGLSQENVHIVKSESIKAPGDYCALLTNLCFGDIFCLADYTEYFEKNKKIDPLVFTRNAINFAIDVTIGKGPSANSLHLDLAEFSFLISIQKSSDLTKGLRDLNINIIDLSSLGEVENELRQLKLKKLLMKENFSISDEPLGKLTEFTFSNKYNMERCVVTIRDYMIAKSRGSVIEIDDVNYAFRGTEALNRVLSSEDMDNIDPYDFEEYVIQLFSAMGYETEHTGQSGDQGIDVIAERDTIRIGIQVKCYSGPVGNGAVQEVLSGVRFYNLDKGFVVTNSYFTQSACELARASRVTLWDRDNLNELICKYCK